MRRRRTYGWAALALSVVAVQACGKETPVSIDDENLPAEPISVEIELPWSDFASNLEVFGGFGSAVDLGIGVLAQDYAGSLDVRTLVRFNAYPQVATVRDSTGTARPDSSLTFTGGYIVAFFDTIASITTGPVNLAASAVQTEWDARTVSWTNAVDTINDQRPWPEAGAGPALPIGTGVWDPSKSDSAMIEIDSAAVALWGDTTDLASGLRLDVVDPGVRLQLRGATLRLHTRPSIRPDTTLLLGSLARNVTFIYDPFPNPPPDGIRIGGTPSWRTVVDIALPEQLDAIPALCAVVSCPHTLSSEEISYAALVLTSRASDPAFQPSDTIRLDVRPVYHREAMPKSPLGTSLIQSILGRPVTPDAFGSSPGAEIEIPFTSYARNLLTGTDDNGLPTPNTLALLSVVEPYSISFASFEGPGSTSEPRLKLILTIGPPVELP